MKRSLSSLLKLLLLVLFTSGSFLLQAQNCTVNAGTPQTLCDGDQLFLDGEFAGEVDSPCSVCGWTQVSGPTATIVDPANLDTEVTNIIGGNVYVFRISATCEDGSLVYQDVTITVETITEADAGPDATYCPDATAFLAANAPGTDETGTWTQAGDLQSGVSIDDVNSNVSALTFDSGLCGTATLIWTISNTNGCASVDTVLITNRGGVEPVDAGPDQNLDHCFSSTHSTQLDATFGGCGIDGQEGTWTVISGPNIPTFNDVNSDEATVSNLVEGTYVLRWTVEGDCATGVDDITITVPAPTADLSNVEIIGGDQIFCDGRTSTVLEGSSPQFVNETVEWIQLSGPGCTIVSPNSPVTSVTGLNGSDTYEFQYTISNSVTNCSGSETVTVSYLNDPPTIDITEDQILGDCGATSVSIAYTYTGSGSNQYSIISGPATAGLTYPTDWQSVGASPAAIGGLDSLGTYTIQFRRRTSVNVSCGTAYDVVTIITSHPPSLSNAGTGAILACDVDSTNLAGSNPDVGEGTWSQVGGPSIVTLSDIHAPVLAISNLSNGLYTFRWTISGGPNCDVNSDETTVLVSDEIPIAVDAGPNQTVCAGTSVFMDADPPTYIFEMGTWSANPSAGVTIEHKHYRKTKVTGLQANTVYTFTWTISNGCGSAGDDVTVTVNDETGPIDSDAGADQCLASGTTSITLDGNDPDPGTGIWTKLTGPAATITDNTLYNTTVTGLTNGDYTFEWAISSDAGCTTSFDTVLITIDNPVTVANAGSDIEVCGDSTRLTGNNPTVGTGEWTQLSGNAGDTIRTPSNYITDVINLQTGVYKFLWTITNGACSSSDTVSVFVTHPPGSISNAGPDIVVCNDNTATMAANTPTVGTGLWTIASGPNSPQIVDVGSPTTVINNLVTGDYQFVWSISAGGFCYPSTDTVAISVTVAADAGDDQDHCDAVTEVDLVGTTSSTGTWTQLSGPNTSTITATSSNSATASGLITGVYKFQYEISATGCTSKDSMLVNLYDPASLADAGPDQEHCNVSVFTMAATTPTYGNGEWSKLSGPAAGSFTDITNPTTTYTGADPGTYIFIWTVSSGQCSNADQVRIINYAEPSDAEAGPDQSEVCGSVVTMDANLPDVGVGEWTTVSKPAGAPDPTITSAILPNTL